MINRISNVVNSAIVFVGKKEMGVEFLTVSYSLFLR